MGVRSSSLLALTVVAVLIWTWVTRSSSVGEEPSEGAIAVVQEMPTELTPPYQSESANSVEAKRSTIADYHQMMTVERAAARLVVEQSSVTAVDAELLESAHQMLSVGVPRRDPFPISASVSQGCVKHGDLRNPTMPQEPAWEYEDKCLTVRRGLVTFAEEDRSEPWASETEALFKRSFNAEPHKCEVRNVECRSNLCVYECVYSEGFNIAAQDSYVNKHGLGHYSDVQGIEHDANGVLVVVRLAVFARE